MARIWRHKISDPLIRTWLYLVSFLVFCIIMVGGATRLTDSGLSIAHWSPIHGIIPPISDADWANEFALYKQIPEYLIQNRGMELSDFKFIFWWEWAHRLLGRVIGIVYLLPFFFFAFTKRISKNEIIKYFLIGCLIGFQGFIGWWMVSSGLSGNRIDVAPYRLAAHLGLAFLLLSILTSKLFARESEKFNLFNPFFVLVIAVYLQIILGAFVAGNRAGFVYNDWPTIGGKILPDAYLVLKPIWHNFFENQQNTQFNHRLWGYIVFLLSIIAMNSRLGLSKIQKALPFFMILLQIIIGVFVLKIFAQFTPPNTIGVLIGVAHQAFAALVFVSIIWVWKKSQIRN